MLTSRIRGGTPFEHWGEQYSINDPELTARLERLGRLTCLRDAEHIQAAVDAENAAYQSIPDLDPDREESPPVGGLPSPATSPPPSNLQLQGAQAVPRVVRNLQSVQTFDSDMAEVDVGAESTSAFLDGHANTQMEHQPQLSPFQRSRNGPRRRQRSLRSSIITRSKASYEHTFWELDSSGRRGRRIMRRPLLAKPSDTTAQ
ncbi:MAG: hypothetical protein Q9184_004043, partial [Pyrenodesmia sp. 2 TL-2023]